jgi:predicted transposase/invertase (TIGR01784 family)
MSCRERRNWIRIWGYSSWHRQKPKEATRSAKAMVMRSQEESYMELIVQIISTKFSELTKKEVRKMLGLKEYFLCETRFYKDLAEEGEKHGIEKGVKETELKFVNLIVKKKMPIELISELTGLSVVAIRRICGKA